MSTRILASVGLTLEKMARLTGKRPTFTPIENVPQRGKTPEWATQYFAGIGDRVVTVAEVAGETGRTHSAVTLAIQRAQRDGILERASAKSLGPSQHIYRRTAAKLDADHPDLTSFELAVIYAKSPGATLWSGSLRDEGMAESRAYPAIRKAVSLGLLEFEGAISKDAARYRRVR